MIQAKLLIKFGNLKHYFFNRYESVHLKNFGIGINEKDCISAEQIHSNNISIINCSKTMFLKNSDGMVTKKKLFLLIRTADCLPIFFYDQREKIIAGIHAGWRGLALKIIDNAVKKIKEIGGKSENIIAAIGPHIRSCCYKVSYSRVKIFSKDIHDEQSILKVRSNEFFLDLEKIAFLQLRNNGIKDNNIDISPYCTYCDENYFSFRREGKKTGRIKSVIGLV